MITPKKLGLTVLLISTVGAGFAQKKDGFTLTGNTNGIPDGEVKLSIYDPKTRTSKEIGTSKVKNGRFVATGKLETDEMVNLQFTPGNWSTSLLLENKPVSVSIDTTGARHYNEIAYGGVIGAILKKPKVTGSKSHAAFEEFEASTTGAGDRQQRLDKQVGYIRSYINENPSSAAGVYILANFYLYNSSYPLDEMEKMVAQFKGDATRSLHYSNLKKEFAERKAVLPGNYAEDFTLLKPDSTKFTLSSTRGQYVLLDFWASWCKPCREAIPHWKEVYAKYKDRGFEIVGVTNDSKWDAWKKAMDQEKMPWIQVADEFPVKGMPARVVTKYKQGTIPLYVLLDKEGKILVKGGNKDDVDRKLAEIFGN